jgi:SAM-dependent methyltransferase
MTKTAELYDDRQSVIFYESRYQAGYMDEWPRDQVEKVTEVIRDAKLPSHGTAIDFGCGTGFFTQVLAESLPGWRVIGTDVSNSALEKARARHSSLEFELLDDLLQQQPRADFLFSHHVLEHVPNLILTRDQMNGFLASDATMLHILPCGNAGSLSHTLCAARMGGIQKELHNRFFFEDVGHLRRLTSDELGALFAPIGFRAEQEYFTGQFWGVFDYFSRVEPDLIPTMTDMSHAVGRSAAVRLFLIGMGLRIAAAARRLNAKVTNLRSRPSVSIKKKLLLRSGKPAFAVARRIDNFVTQRAEREWVERKTAPSGDQMLILFRRSA